MPWPAPTCRTTPSTTRRRRSWSPLFPERQRPAATSLIDGPVQRVGGVLGNLIVIAVIALGTPAWVGVAGLPIAGLWVVGGAAALAHLPDPAARGDERAPPGARTRCRCASCSTPPRSASWRRRCSTPTRIASAPPARWSRRALPRSRSMPWRAPPCARRPPAGRCCWRRCTAFSIGTAPPRARHRRRRRALESLLGTSLDDQPRRARRRGRSVRPPDPGRARVARRRRS